MGAPVTQFSHDDIDPSTVSVPSFGHDDIDPASIQGPDTSLLSKIGNAATSFGKAVDSVTAAPTRAAIFAAQKGDNPAAAFRDQFAGDPEKAPTGEMIAAKIGLSTQGKPGFTAAEQQAFDEKYNPGLAQMMQLSKQKYQDQELPSPASVAGHFVDLAADPTLLLPVSKALKIGETVGDVGARYAPKVVDALKDFAERMAVNATGATGAQAAKFDANAGRELLNRNVVQFGDSQAQIAKRASGEVSKAESGIDSSLNSLQSQGVKIDESKIAENLQNQVTELRKRGSQAGVADQLQKVVDNMKAASEARGTSELGVLEGEQEKRGWNKAAKNWADPNAGQAGKAAYQEVRGAVEDAATAANPELADKFTSAKKTYGLMAPIEEAAEKRAGTQKQSQLGNLMDTGAFLSAYHEAGGGVEGFAAGLATVAGRRVISPRLASSLAVSSDKLANGLRNIPEFAKMADSDPVAFKALTAHLALGTSDEAQQALKAAQNPPAKGPDKWANDGHQKLIDHAQVPKDQSLLEKSKASLLADPKTKSLLIQASDLKPGSKAMDSVLSKIKAKAKIASDE